MTCSWQGVDASNHDTFLAHDRVNDQNAQFARFGTQQIREPLAKGKPWDQKHWDHASVVGVLSHVSNNARPDAAFAVSQVARFTAKPKVSHARAIKSIARHLKGTIDKGLVFTVNDNHDLACWADADFAGTFGQEPSGSAKAVKS